MSAAIPVAVVGTGRMGRHHARIYHEMPEARLIGVMDRDPARVFDLVYKDLEAAMHFARHSGLRRPLAGLLAQMEVPPFP